VAVVSAWGGDSGALAVLRIAMSVNTGRASWMDLASCAESDPEAWFPEKGGSVREAKAICMTCPVRANCLEYALDHREAFGIWGALSEHERRAVARQRRDAA
jgi:WhiB family transcriptional regulator, redox-sensing transcriptional regulator